MTMPKISKNKILIIALIIVGVIGYYIITTGNEPEPLTTVESGDAASISQQLVIELTRLQALRSVDVSLFKDPAFASLEDYTQAVVPQPLGRSNPFAPIGSI